MFWDIITGERGGRMKKIVYRLFKDELSELPKIETKNMIIYNLRFYKEEKPQR